jgi:hypothetical protein
MGKPFLTENFELTGREEIIVSTGTCGETRRPAIFATSDTDQFLAPSHLKKIGSAGQQRLGHPHNPAPQRVSATIISHFLNVY